MIDVSPSTSRLFNCFRKNTLSSCNCFRLPDMIVDTIPIASVDSIPPRTHRSPSSVVSLTTFRRDSTSAWYIPARRLYSLSWSMHTCTRPSAPKVSTMSVN